MAYLIAIQDRKFFDNFEKEDFKTLYSIERIVKMLSTFTKDTSLFTFCLLLDIIKNYNGKAVENEQQ
ncbi:MAG: hypothetical protein ACKO7A_35430 [Microcystis sp.]|uniref:Uncharacterized protein n=1 Tax=Microcystis aeruginosa PCC 7806SL TaxID=1903187 RepID=A0AB33BHZ8_MICA7|nr:hypothetical protein BH695_1173 [Microcystis aeruginosa PCC 7806SL]ELS47633.1 hypothetical protein C789_2582 [Microcystis aeruginosa FACHB-905 = DIANCHI905]TRU04388.1 MAG: hypothetical protein EWV61_06770 [Microcystis aeruginosa Ma_AC_P_19900807_S300]